MRVPQRHQFRHRQPSVYGAVNVEDAMAVSVDTFFYKIGEEIFINNDRRPVLQNRCAGSASAPTPASTSVRVDGRVPTRR